MNQNAIIIGAGPAGCIAAMLLSRGGWDVRLIEQHRFPRDKVCGECLSALGTDVIDRVGLTESFQSLNPVRLTRTLIHSPDGKTLDVSLPQPMWGISRLRLDAWLLDHARIAGTKILQPARCEKLIGEDGTVVVRDLEQNLLHQLKASWVLLADGKRALAARRPPATLDLGIKAHFEAIAGPRDAIELFGVDGHYGGVAPIEDRGWNVAFSIPNQRLRDTGGEIDALFERVIEQNPVLRQRFRGARRIIEWLASPLPRFAVSDSWPEKTIPLGNAAASIEPVGGEGMGLAMRSAELASGMLLSGSVNLVALQRAFAHLWRTRSVSCRIAGMMVSQPTIARWIAPLGGFKPIARAAMSMLGKTPAPAPSPSGRGLG